MTFPRLLSFAAGLIVIFAATFAVAADSNPLSTQSFSNQDRPSATVMPMDGGKTIYLYGNTWRETTKRFTLTQGSVLEFDFASDSRGEMHGIGFDEDSRYSSIRSFKLYGTQNWDIRNVASYTTSAGEFQTIRIPVGQYYTGTNMRLVLVNDNDNDVQQAANTSQFRNVKLVNSGNDGGGTGGKEPIAGSCMNSEQVGLLAAHNNARSTGRSCGGTFYPAALPLTWNCALAGAAKNRSADMAKNNFFSHTGSD